MDRHKNQDKVTQGYVNFVCFYAMVYQMKAKERVNVPDLIQSL